MKVTPLKIPDVKMIEPEVFEDERGFFYESFNQKKFNEVVGKNISFVQENHSMSKIGVLRGLHYQKEPCAQGKLIRVISGEIYDVALDIRKKSPNYGHWVSAILSAENKNQLWIPEGFAHGFLTLSDKTEVVYLTTKNYSKDHERCILWNDTKINIEWPNINKELIISKKDKMGNNFE